MKTHLLLCVCALSVAVAGVGYAASISTIETQASGTAVTLDTSPVVTAILSQPGTWNGKTYTGWSFLVQDSTGSIDVFATATVLSGLSYTPSVGNIITSISGSYSPFHQIPEIATPTALTSDGTAGTVPGPVLTTIPAINVATEPFSTAGYLLELDNVTIGGISGAFGITNLTGTITDGSSNSMTFYYWPTSYSVSNANLFGQAIPTSPVNMTGFVSVYNGVAEFTPLTITTVPEPSTLVLLSAGCAAAASMLLRRRAGK